VFGILGGIGPHPEDVMHMRRTADRLFGNDYVWSVLGVGSNQIPVAMISAAIGRQRSRRSRGLALVPAISRRATPRRCGA
jgi:beta-keto acid cleavage enzyme